MDSAVGAFQVDGTASEKAPSHLSIVPGYSGTARSNWSNMKEGKNDLGKRYW